MSGYLIADVRVDDPEGYEHYKSLVPGSLRAFGATYLARGGEVTVLEGSWSPRRLVVVRFESSGRAQAWWASDEYREAKRIRHATARTNMIVVDGVA